VYFTTPSGNIKCAIGSSSTNVPVACLINQNTILHPPRPADCLASWSWAENVVVLSNDGAQSGRCTGDSPVPQVSAPLPYGSLLTYGGYSCLSAETGVTCTEVAGSHGFTVNRASFTPR